MAYRSNILYESGKILLVDNECSEDYYDLLTFFESFSSRSCSIISGKLIDDQLLLLAEKKLNSFCRKHPEMEYNKFIREWHQRYLDDSGSLYSMVSIMHHLIIEWYERGMQVSGYSTTRASIMVDLNITLLEVMILALSVMHQVHGVNIIGLTTKDMNTVKSAVSIFNSSKAVNDFISTAEKDSLKTLVTKIMESGVYASFVNVFSIEDRWNIAFPSCFLERTDFTQNNETCNVVRSFIEVFGFDCLRRRRIFVREKGVILRLLKPYDGVTVIFVREMHDTEDHHYIFIEYVIGEHYISRDVVLDIQNLKNSYYQIMFETDYSVTLGILYWLGIFDDTPDTVTKVLKYLTSMVNSTVHADIESGLSSLISECIRVVARSFSKDNIVYEDPANWNYQASAKRSVPDKSKEAVFEKKILVGRYVRKLPSGSHASVGAKRLAENYCMELKDGYTFIDEFERKQTVYAKNRATQ